MESDMPHPYKPKGKVVFGPEAILERPALAAYIAAIATLWTAVEEGWGLILANMLDADAKVGVALYLQLTGSASQFAVLKAVADERLSGELREAFMALLKEEKGRARERNTVVHGRWAVDAGTPDALLLGERDWLPRQIAEMNHFYRRENPHRNPFREEKFERPDPTFQIYVERDFKSILERLRVFSRNQTSLAVKISASHHLEEWQRQEPPPQSDSARPIIGSRRPTKPAGPG